MLEAILVVLSGVVLIVAAVATVATLYALATVSQLKEPGVYKNTGELLAKLKIIDEILSNYNDNDIKFLTKEELLKLNRPTLHALWFKLDSYERLMNHHLKQAKANEILDILNGKLVYPRG